MGGVCDHLTMVQELDRVYGSRGEKQSVDRRTVFRIVEAVAAEGAHVVRDVQVGWVTELPIDAASPSLPPMSCHVMSCFWVTSCVYLFVCL